MGFKFKPKVTKDREATKEELDCIKDTEEMLKQERLYLKLPPASQQVRDIATTHWKSLKAWIKGSQVIAPHDIAEKRWKVCLECPHLLYDEVNPDTNKKDGRCTHCGCFMNVKVHYAVAECPIGKWPKECKCNQNEECDKH